MVEVRQVVRGVLAGSATRAERGLTAPKTQTQKTGSVVQPHAPPSRTGPHSLVKKLVVLFTGTAILLGLVGVASISTSVFSSGDEYVAKVDDAVISADLYRYSLLIAKEAALADYPNVSPSDLWNYQRSEGSPTFAQELEEFELGKLVRAAVINNLFKAYGLTLTAAQAELREKNVAEKIESYGGRKQADELFRKYHVTYEDFVRFYEDYDRFELLFLHYFGVDGVYPVSFEEIDNYYAENNARIKSIYIPIIDDSGNALSENDLLAAANLAVEVQEKANKAGSDFDELVKLYNEDTSLPADGYIISRSYTTIPEYATASFSMKEGEVRTVLTGHGYYVMKRYSVFDSPIYTHVERQKALFEMKSDQFESLIIAVNNTSNIAYNEELTDGIRIDEIARME